MKNLRCFLILCAMAGWTNNAQAVAIFLTGPSESTINQSFDIGFWLATPDQPILGGGAILTYDPSLVSYSGFEFNPTLTCPASCNPNEIDLGLSNFPTDGGTGALDFLSFSNFDGLDYPGGVLLGTFTFAGTSLGLAGFGLDANSVAGWASGVFPFSAIDPADIDVAGLSVNIVNAVPEPPTVLLLLLGLLLFAVPTKFSMLQQD